MAKKIRLTQKDREKRRRITWNYAGIMEPVQTMKFFNNHYALVDLGGKLVVIQKKTGMQTSLSDLKELHARKRTQVSEKVK